MSNKILISRSSSQTKKIAENLARCILQKPLTKKALILTLDGELGSGKTTFLQGFAKGLGLKQKILSPTFIIMQKFPISNFQFSNFYHIDCYRIKKPKEILELGFKEICNNPQNIIAIEWAEKIYPILPKDIIEIQFNFVSKNIRQINIKCTGSTRAFSMV